MNNVIGKSPEFIKLEEELYDFLNQHCAKVNECEPDSVFNPDNKTGFVVIRFAHAPDESDENMSADDKAVSISAGTLTVMPYVTPREDGSVGPSETNQHGIQATATALLVGVLQSSGLASVMQMAQEIILKRRRLQ